MRRTIICLSLAVIMTGLLPGLGRAQSAPKMPDVNGLLILVRTTIIALNHANQTGNYTVFRDLGSPGFRAPNTAAKLGAIFAKQRAAKLDFGPVALIAPQFSKKPVIDKQKLLRLTGYFPSRPLRLQFDLAYQWIENRWRIFGISVQTKPAPKAKKKR